MASKISNNIRYTAFLSCLLLACHLTDSKQKSSEQYIVKTHAVVAGKSADIDSVLYATTQQRNHMLLLPAITASVDTTEIRAWCDEFPFLKGQLYILKHSTTWQIQAINYRCRHIDDTTVSYVIARDNRKPVVTNVEKSISLDSLLLAGLQDMPTQDSIKDFREKTVDGSVFTIEVSEKGKYNVIEYQNPRLYTDSIHQKINTVTGLLRRSIKGFNGSK